MATTAEPTETLGTKSGPTTAKGWGTDAPDQPLRPMEFERRRRLTSSVSCCRRPVHGECRWGRVGLLSRW